MSEAELPTQRIGKVKGVPAEECFNVASHQLDEQELPFERLALDLDMKHGQIRKINGQHRDLLVEQFKDNPPEARLELTTVLDQNMHPPLLCWLCGPMCCCSESLVTGNMFFCFPFQ